MTNIWSTQTNWKNPSFPLNSKLELCNSFRNIQLSYSLSHEPKLKKTRIGWQSFNCKNSVHEWRHSTCEPCEHLHPAGKLITLQMIDMFRDTIIYYYKNCGRQLNYTSCFLIELLIIYSKSGDNFIFNYGWYQQGDNMTKSTASQKP